jgi:hypothetical protein
MLRFGLVCLAGLIGGSICGFIVFVLAAQIWPINITNVLTIAVVFGGGFGVVAFPISYYIFLKAIPLRLSLAVTIPATILFGCVGTYFFVHPSGSWHGGEGVVVMSVAGHGFLYQNYAEILLALYGPSFLGLLLSSIALNRFAKRFSMRKIAE